MANLPNATKYNGLEDESTQSATFTNQSHESVKDNFTIPSSEMLSDEEKQISTPPSCYYSSSDEEQPNGAESKPSIALTVSKARGVVIILTLAGINFLNTMGSGLLIAVLPRIARDVNLPESLILC